jgi:acetyl esterase/lipase
LRIIKGPIYSAIAIVVGCIALLAFFIGPSTIRAMKASQSPATLAERQAADGPLRYTEKFIAGAVGDPPVRIVIVEPKDALPGRPGILDMHGGGYMYGSPEASLTLFLEHLVLKFGITAISVDYRLAPGTHYPGSLHDNYAALQWFHDNAVDMGVDPARIAIIGLSAGGGHAAALSIYARDQGEVPILFQALLAPMLDDRTGATVDPGKSVGRFLWTRDDNRKG